MRQPGPWFFYVLSAAIVVWFLYLSIEVARHVGAWPFA